MKIKINFLSSFAAGILLATSICSVAYLTDNQDVQKASAIKSVNKNTEKLSEKQMKEKLVSTGYIVLTKDEYETNLKEAKAADPKQAAADDKTTAVTRVVVNVSPGMTSIDVGNVLVQAKIIENAFNFSKDIESRGLENKLRPGAYVIDSGMSYDQIISTIFK